MTLRDYRESAGLTQEALASLAGLAETSISEFEGERRIPSAASAGKLCAALSLRLGRTVNTWDVWPARFKNPARAEEVHA